MKETKKRATASHGCNYQYQSSIAMVMGPHEITFPLSLANMLPHPHPHCHPHSSPSSLITILTHHSHTCDSGQIKLLIHMDNRSARVAVCMLHDRNGQGVFLPNAKPIERARVRLLENKVWQKSHIFLPTNVQPALICRLFIGMEGRLSKTGFENAGLNLSQSITQRPINNSCTIPVGVAEATFHQHQMFISYFLPWQS